MIKTNKFSVVNFLILLSIVFGGSFAFIGCGENDQPFIEIIDNQTLAIDARKTLEIYIEDSDKKDMHTVSAFSENSNIATVSVNRRNINAGDTVDLFIEGVAEGHTIVTVSATDSSGQDNATFDQVFVVTVVEPEIIVSTPSPLKESTLDVSVITLNVKGLTFDSYLTNASVNVSGIDGVYASTTRISDTEIEVFLSYNYTDFNSDSILTLTVNPDAFEEDYRGPSFTSELPVLADLRGHVEGPWLWMIAPGGNIDVDNLSAASDGVITEAQIAQSGVSEGEHFNSLQWTRGRLLPTTVCGIFLCSSDNVINVVRSIGLTNRNQLTQYSAYALINIYSPRDQYNVLMGVGSDDSVKVWLNGEVVYNIFAQRRTTGIQNQFHVNLNAGNNLLLVKVCNHGSWVGNDDWGMFFRIYISTQDYTISLPK